MSLLQSPVPVAAGARNDKQAATKRKEAGHRIRVWIAGLASLLLLVSLAAYGANYYLLPLDQRPFSDKHELLRPVS